MGIIIAIVMFLLLFSVSYGKSDVGGNVRDDSKRLNKDLEW